MKMTKKVLAILLSLMLVLGAVAVGGMSASALADNAQLVLGSETIIENGEILQTSGTRWFINEDGNGITLELSNKNVRGAHFIQAENLDLTILGSATSDTVRSSVTVSNGNLMMKGRFNFGSAIDVDGDMTFERNGTLGGALNVSSSAGEAIHVGGTFTINGDSVYAKSESVSENEYAISANEFVLNNGEVFSLGERNSKEVLISTLSGSGKPDSPFEISTFGELKDFSSLVNVGVTDLCAVMMNDIDASESSWKPIGNEKCNYTGTFDGCNHKVIGLKRGSGKEDYVGLFGRVDYAGIVRNVGIEGGRMNGINYVGGIVGYNSGTVANCYYDGTVSGDVFTGGIVGINLGTVINCCNTGSVSGRRESGGIVGRNGGTISNCCNTGNVTGDRDAGGVAGTCSTGTVKNSYNTGSVTAFSGVGGVVGENFSYNGPSVTSDCYNIGDVSGDDYVGGIVGMNTLSTVTNSYNAGSVSGQTNVGGVVGFNSTSVTNCYYDSDRCTASDAIGLGSGTNVTGLTTVQMTGINALDNMLFAYEDGAGNPWLVKENKDELFFYPHLSGFAYDSEPADKNWPPIYDSAAYAPYEISNYEELVAFAQVVNGNEDEEIAPNPSASAVLTADITVTELKWERIAKNASHTFTGTFDGRGHTITGLDNSEASNKDNSGLFGFIGEGGTVKSVRLESAYFTGGSVGGIAYQNNGTISVCSFDGSIAGSSFVGGIAVENNGIITNCYNTGDVSGDDYVGGVVVRNYGSVTNCYNTGDVSGRSNVGGIAGRSTGTILNCYNTGIINGKVNYVGGIAGQNYYATIENCYNTGAVTGGGSKIGGIAGISYGTADNCFNSGSVSGNTDVGGVTGENGGMLEYCYNTGNVSGGDYVGGVAGVNNGNDGSVSSCYNTGAVSGNNYVGGVAGENSFNGIISNCYNTGAVSGNNYVGGVVGQNTFNCIISNCYNTGNVTATVDGAYIGGAAGNNVNDSSLKNCYYASDRVPGIPAIGHEDSATHSNVTYLTTGQMTGENALDNMVFTYESGEENPWLTRANDDINSFYPHLMGFAYDSEPLPGNWPPKIAVYPLWVGGNQVTSDNMDSLNELDGISVAEGGSVIFEPDADGKGGTLYLNNATITGTQSYKSGGTHYSNILVENKEFNITINLEGENTLGPAERGIWMVNNSASSGLALTGDGKLSITAEENGIVINCDLLIDGADINVTATGGDSGGTGIIADDIDIRNSFVYAEGTGDQYGIFCASALTISDSSVESGCTGTYGRGLYFSDEENFTVSGDSFVTLEGGTRYGALWIKGSLITENGNEIVEPANYIIDPLETGSDVYLVYDVTADEKIPAVNVIITNPLTITVTANPTGGGTITGGGKTYKGADVALTAAPETGYDFVSWTEGNSVVSTNAKYSFTVEQSRNLVANFKLQVKSVSVSANPTEGGTVTGGGTYDYGSSATVTATPKDHYHFVNWTENGEEVGTDAAYTFTVDKDRSLVANFAIDTFTITFENDDGAPLQSGSVAYGETPAYTGETPTKEATAEYTYTFAGWSPEITSVSGDVTYTAVYASNPVDYKLTWTVDGESYKNETIPFGGNITLPDVEAKEGYTFAWVDEIPATMPAEDVTVNGQFTAIEYTATFVDENGETVAEIPYTVETEKLEAPAVPVKEGYNGEWEEYELTTGGITVKPVYTPADICPLDNEYHGDNFWGRLVKFFHTVIWKAFNLLGMNIYIKIW